MKFSKAKRILSAVLSILMVVSLLPMQSLISVSAAEVETASVSASPTPYDGVPVTPKKINSGNYLQFGLTESNWSTYNGYYGIRDAKELYGFADMVNGGTNRVNAVVLQDIVVNETVSQNSGATYSWTPIGTRSDRSFIGTFDGNGHTISGLYYKEEDNYAMVGLFRYIGEYNKWTGGKIRNLTLANSYFHGCAMMSGFVSVANGYSNEITNCKLAEDFAISIIMQSQEFNTGGFLGTYGSSPSFTFNIMCTIKNCVNLGKIYVKNKFADGKALKYYIGTISGRCAEENNAFEYVTANNCYYKKGVITDADGVELNYGLGGGPNRGGNRGCTSIDSTSVTHSCVTVEHKAVSSTCQYGGSSAYTQCLICGSIKSGSKTTYGTTSHVAKDGYYIDGDKHYQLCKYDCGTHMNIVSHTYNSEGFCVCGVAKPATQNNNVYEIYKKSDLIWFAQFVNSGNKSANAILKADIDLAGYDWKTIAETGLYYNGYGEDLGYTGTFDGNGHIIKNVKVKSSTTMDASCGLFGTVSGTVKNLVVDGFTFVDGGKDIRTGAIVGQLITANGKISNCYVLNATITPGEHVTGGIAGCVYDGTIENCYVAKSNINGTKDRYGYVVGDSRGDKGTGDRPGTVKNCYADNDIVYSVRTGNISDCETVTTEQFASGEVAYKLNGKTNGGTLYYQNLDNGKTVDAYPVLKNDHGTVYYGYKDCEATEFTYINSKPKATQGHDYSVATCLDKQVCSYCGAVGELNPDNHVSTETYYVFDNENTHSLYHSCCDAHIKTENHTANDATCQGISYCSVCDTSFGSIDKNNHTGELKCHKYDNGTHIYKYSCCGMQEGVAVAHNVKYTVDDETDTITAHCEDCGAEGTAQITIESREYNGYNLEAEYTGSGILGYWRPFEAYKFTYSDENGNVVDNCKNIGDYTVTMTIGDVSVSKEFTISKRVLEITFARGSHKTYDTTNIIRLSSYDVANVVVYDPGDYDGAWDDIRDSVSVNSDKLFVTVSDSVPNTYTTCKIEGVELIGEDKGNYTIAESFENVPLKGDYGDFGISEIEVWIEPYDQYITMGAELDQTAYTVEHLDPMFTLEGVVLYELDERTIAVNTENVKVTHNGVDITAYCNFDRCSDFTANLSKVCEGHTFDDNGFCATGECDTYQKPNEAYDDYGEMYYEIANAGQLYWFAEQVNVYGNNGICGKLMTDIDINPGYTFNSDGTYSGGTNPRIWTPIGNMNSWTAYTGFFDGNGYTVSGIYLNTPDSEYVGMFNYVAYSQGISDVHLTNSYFCGGGTVGSLIAYLGDGNIVECSADSTVTVAGDSYNVGGLVGDASYATIQNCYSTANIDCENAGGIVGYSYADISNCYTTYSNIVDNNRGSITNCYYVADEETDEYDGTTAVTADKLASGEVAYLLQAGIKGEEIYDEETGEWVTGDPEEIWGQRIGTETYPTIYGSKVYQVTNCKDEVAYSNTDEKLDHIFDGGYCITCGIMEGIAQVAGYSITLEDKIAVNYFIDLADEVLNDTASKVVFNYIDSGETYTKKVFVSDATKSGDYYKFTCEVAAKEMTSNIAAQVVTSNAKSKVFNYSVKQYAEVILADAETYAKEQDIVKTMLNYGANAQVNFGYNTDSLANDTVYMTEEDKALNVEDTVFDAYAHSASDKANGLTYYGSALVLESETAIKLYFTYDSEANIADVNVTSDSGKTVEHKKNGKYYEVKISGIRPDELDEMYETTVNGVTVNFGTFSYGKMAMGTSNENLKNTMKALYAYNQAALAYKV